MAVVVEELKQKKKQKKKSLGNLPWMAIVVGGVAVVVEAVEVVATVDAVAVVVVVDAVVMVVVELAVANGGEIQLHVM